MTPQAPTHPEDDRLLELAYGELPAAEARALRTHVDGCPRCRTVLDGIAAVRTVFRSLPAEPAPDRGLDSLLSYGEQAAARARSRRRGLRIVGVLSAVAALAVVWLVLPPPRRQTEVAAPAPAARPADALARADTERVPAQGDRAAEPAETPPALQAEKRKLSATPEPPAPARRPLAEPGKRDAPAEQKALAQPPPAGRAEMAGAGAQANASPGALAASDARTSAPAVGAMAMKKGTVGATKDEGAVPRPEAAASSPPAATTGETRAREAAKIAAAPLSGALASSDVAPAGPLAKAAPADAAARAAPAQGAMRVGLGSPQQQARLAEIQRKLVSARGDERKALLMEQCELEASLGRGPDAVLTCSNVAREFPGTPEARRASELARGFSLQPPVQPDDR